MDKLGRILVGLLFILLGVIFALNALMGWDLQVFFPGWWTLIIIVPCLVDIFTGGINATNLIGVALGVMLFLAAQDIISYGTMWALVPPVILIALGIKLMVKGKFRRDVTDIKVANGALGEHSAVFGDSRFDYSGQIFSGANCSTVFGRIELDLCNAIVDKNAVISCSTVFGGMVIYFPEGVKLKVGTTSIFGGVDVQKKITADLPEAPTIFLDGTCVFGGVEVR